MLTPRAVPCQTERGCSGAGPEGSHPHTFRRPSGHDVAKVPECTLKTEPHVRSRSRRHRTSTPNVGYLHEWALAVAYPRTLGSPRCLRRGGHHRLAARRRRATGTMPTAPVSPREMQQTCRLGRCVVTTLGRRHDYGAWKLRVVGHTRTSLFGLGPRPRGSRELPIASTYLACTRASMSKE
jgi:hypothetical protein